MIEIRACPMLSPREAVSFWARVAKGEPDSCWPWTSSRTSNGYGRFRFSRGRHRAHRIAFLLSYGEAPEGVGVLHTCDNPPCCNPAHLFLGSQSENVRDMVNKGRCRAQYNAVKLSHEIVGELRQLNAAGHSFNALAARFGIHRTTVARAATGRSW